MSRWGRPPESLLSYFFVTLKFPAFCALWDLWPLIKTKAFGVPDAFRWGLLGSGCLLWGGCLPGEGVGVKVWYVPRNPRDTDFLAGSPGPIAGISRKFGVPKKV